MVNEFSLTRLVELRPMLIFEEEAQFKLESHVSKSSCNPVMQVVGSMLMNHFERGMCELEPDTLDVFTRYGK